MMNTQNTITAIGSQTRCRWGLQMGVAALAALLIGGGGASAAIVVTFEKIARIGDQVPGRETLNVVFNGRAFQPNDNPGVLSRPSINDAGEVVFRGVSSAPNDFNLNSAIGLYAKTPSFPLIRLVDTTLTSGSPTFPVPGRPAGAVFTNFDPPLVNNAGQVVFRATFGGSGGSGSGFYATMTTGGPIVKIVDNFDQVPGFPGQLFTNGFTFGGTNPDMLISLNDAGQVIFMGRFQRTGQPFEDQGLYGSTVAGGALVRLADTTGSVIPGNETLPFRSLSQTTLPALNNNGIAIFSGAIGSTPSNILRGVFTVPVDGSAAATTRARQGQTVAVSSGPPRAYFSLFGGHDINDSGQFVFQHAFGSGATDLNGLFKGNLSGGPIAPVVDGAGGFAIPGRPGAFTTITIAAINELGQMGFHARDNGFPNGQGTYTADLSGSALGLVANNATIPPGRATPSVFTNFNFLSAAINDLGNQALAPAASNEAQTDSIFGLYFYDACTHTLERIIDNATSAPVPAIGLGDVFAGSGCAGSPCERTTRIFQGFEVRAGHYRSINNSNAVAFLTAFSTFNVGVYVAHVQAGGGPVTMNCPPDVTLECPANSDTATTGVATATGCGTVNVTYHDSAAPGCGNGQVITRTWTASNGAGQPVTCTQTITIADHTPPVLTVPANVTIECGAAHDPGSTGQATAADGCDSAPAVTFTDSTAPGDCAQKSIITRTWTATDACGNTASATQTITVTDTAAPTLTAPANLSIECGASTDPTNTGQATATDGCDSAPAVTYSDNTASGACAQGSIITRTWTATDACGNTASATQTITVADTTAPVLTVPADAALECGASTSPASTGQATATDGCDPAPTVTFTDSTASGACAQAAVITRTWTATDACGNTASVAQTITVTDATAPVLTVPANAALECGASTDPAHTGQATATDGCDSAPAVTYSDSTASGACSQGFVITRTWTATDACGNTASAAQTITVSDTVAPVLTVPADALIECGASTAPANTGQATATDGCDPAPVITYSDSTAPGDCAQESVITRTWTATDACGHAVSAAQTITSVDAAPPVFTQVPANTTVECDGHGNSAALQAWLAGAAATDACGGVTLTNNFTALNDGCGATGATTVTWTATDDCGNTATAVATFTVADTTPPTFVHVPVNRTVECDGNGNFSDLLSWLASPTAQDNCGGVTLTNNFGMLSDGCDMTGSATVTWTATDACGNTAAISATFAIVDTTPPTLTCPADVQVVARPGECAAHGLNLGWPVAVDSCSTVTVTNNAPAEFPAGTTVVTWTARDACGLVATCQQNVVVQDKQRPLVRCALDTTMLWPPNHDLENVGLTASASDNCGDTTVEIFVYSDEDDDEVTGDGMFSPDAKEIASDTLRLRAERRVNRFGRVYLIVVKATDEAGNTAYTSCTVVVPHNRTWLGLQAVALQAALAQAYFQCHQAPPPLYELIGDGPILGPKQ